MNKAEQELLDYLKARFERGPTPSDADLKVAIRAIKVSGLREAVSIVKYWQDGHKSRLRTSPDNEFIKCEIQDLEELRNHMILSTMDNP